jgi:hypothetical protein
MADRLLFIGWEAPARGLEARAIEVFNEALGLIGRMQQEGRVESFDVALLGPNMGLDGFIVIKGTAEQITALRMDEDFMRNTADAQLSVDGIRHIEGVCNEGIARMMTLYQERVADLAGRT